MSAPSSHPGNRTPSSAKQRPNTKPHFHLLKTQYYLHSSYVSMEKLSIHRKRFKQPKLAKRTTPTKVIYIASPMRVTTTAAAFRSLVQKLTGRDSDVAAHAAISSQVPEESQVAPAAVLGAAAGYGDSGGGSTAPLGRTVGGSVEVGNSLVAPNEVFDETSLGAQMLENFSDFMSYFSPAL
ncbi:hypothetical protein Cni_G04648 [Canna indica]|uniref:VQ domain-containing protein n=1 Tax=Canna indica TaxID=4628 RepID=A0AAQ3JTX4_9LILI|nr:hypothetical protein Cni_G04648 [Canna indica]